MRVYDNQGRLKTTAIAAGGDNLGNHAATQNLDMNGFEVLDALRVQLPEGSTPGAPTSSVKLWAEAESSSGQTLPQIIFPGGVVATLARDNLVVVRNMSGGTLNKGTLVSITGFTSAIPTVSEADADDPGLPCHGVLAENIDNTQYGRAMVVGKLSGINTVGFSAGDPIYLSQTAGAFTATPPPHPAMRQIVGFVASVGASAVIHVELQFAAGNVIGTRQNSFAIGDAAAGSKDVLFKNASTLTLRATPTGARTVTLPDATATLVGSHQWTGASLLVSNTASAPTALNATIDSMPLYDAATTQTWVMRNAAQVRDFLRLATDRTTVTVVNDANFQTAFSFTIPANTLATAGRGVMVAISGDYANASGTNQRIRLQVNYGSTVMFQSGNSAIMSSDASTHPWWLLLEIHRNGANNAQRVSGMWSMEYSTTAPTAGTGSLGSGTSVHYGTYTGIAAEDSTGALTFSVKLQHIAAHASLTWRKHYGVAYYT
jgi:co-chaperonin GroES (HSP10)